MKKTKGISIKAALIGIVGIFVVVLIAVSINNVYKAKARNAEAQRVSIANDLSDLVIKAAGFEAIERGVTATGLSSLKPASTKMLTKIGNLRSNGDKALAEAFATAEGLAAIDPSNTPFIGAIKELKEAQSALKAARIRADSNLSRASKDFPPSEWIGIASNMIRTAADMRLDALTSPARTETLQGALRMNAEVKHSVWLASENAGIERAIIGSHISGGKTIGTKAMNKLTALRAINQLSIARVKTLAHDSSTDQSILSSIRDMESNFMGSYERTRQSVYAQMDTANYPISGGDWIGAATNAINSILAVSTAISDVVKGQVTTELASAKKEMMAAFGLLALALGLGIISFFAITRKVLRPIENLATINNVMGYIEQSGDLTKRIEINATDETGAVADSFNKMMVKFHTITNDMQKSAEHLASASEELSCSATQIASGTEEQDSRASHVATASQEMSATVVEVARNASGAAEAAKAASDTAIKGGEVVGKTIESMNGIAVTARESSEVITTLGARSKDIGNIIEVIDQIADQTNLLALNAAIEAARAGDQGRGFAVVADEVKKLADKTSDATKEIGTMISSIQEETEKAIITMDKEIEVVEEGVSLASEAGNALSEIVTQVDHVSEVINQIATASEEQATAADQISGDIESVASITKETSTGAHQIVQASQEMASLASNLQRSVSIFKLDRGESVEEPVTKEVSYEAPQRYVAPVTAPVSQGVGGMAGADSTLDAALSRYASNVGSEPKVTGAKPKDLDDGLVVMQPKASESEEDKFRKLAN